MNLNPEESFELLREQRRAVGVETRMQAWLFDVVETFVEEVVGSSHIMTRDDLLSVLSRSCAVGFHLGIDLGVDRPAYAAALSAGLVRALESKPDDAPGMAESRRATWDDLESFIERDELPA